MTDTRSPRKPQVFDVHDPRLVEPAAVDPPTRGRDRARADAAESRRGAARPAHPDRPRPTIADLKRGIGWGALMMAAAAALASLAAGVWFTRFVSVALAREDWVGWTATALAAVIVLSLLAILARELLGLARLRRLEALRKSADDAVRRPDPKREREVVQGLAALYAGRADCRWALARLDEHARDVRDAGELLALADRELVAPLDQEARRTILKSARRVAVVSAMSPMMLVTMSFVLVENVRMLRALAGLYGGRPGTTGSLRLARMVLAHLVASGGVALTDDLFGQFISQDVLRRLSQRLGEGAFNGALTARIGVAAIDLVRPVPYLEAGRVRVRDLVAELFRKERRAEEPEATTGQQGSSRGGSDA